MTSATPTPNSAPAPTPIPEPDKDGDGSPDAADKYPNNPLASTPQSITITCSTKGKDVSFTIDRGKPSWKEVWATDLPVPSDSATGGVLCEDDENAWGDGAPLEPVSPAEQVVWNFEKKHDEYSIRTEYEQCIDHGDDWMRNKWPVGPGQVKEAEAALLLCPKHPDAPAIRSRIADMKQFSSELKSGAAFDDGNYRVGESVKPGTYYAENVSGCYWERLSSSGDIIDNSFVMDGLRVQVTIRSSDFSFHTEGCGSWRKLS